MVFVGTHKKHTKLKFDFEVDGYNKCVCVRVCMPVCMLHMHACVCVCVCVHVHACMCIANSNTLILETALITEQKVNMLPLLHSCASLIN